MKILIAEKFKELFNPRRYKIYFGGRGGTKSWSFAQALILLCVQKPLRVLCTREYQGSIKESVHKLLCDTIVRMELEDFFEITQTSIIGKNGSMFFFEGLKNNTTKIKSIEGIDICWCEEAEAITEYSWDLLIPTIRKGDSEIWVSFNPFDEMDATYQNFVAPYEHAILDKGHYTDTDVHVSKVSWRDNPWFPKELAAERDKCKKENFNKYLHIWEGEPSTDYQDSIIKPEWINAAIDAHTKLGWKARGTTVIGFDPADSGEDAKAYCMRHGSLIKQCEQWLTGDLEEAVEKTFNAAIDNKVTDIVYDSIGIGAGAKIKFKQLKGNNKVQVQGFCGSEIPEYPENKYKDDRLNKEVFRNRRAQGYWYLRDRFEATYRAIEKGEFTDPENMISLDSSINNLKQLKSELSRIRRKTGRNENSLIQIESKQDMASRGLRSPNLADALMYTFANRVESDSFNAPLDYSRMD